MQREVEPEDGSEEPIQTELAERTEVQRLCSGYTDELHRQPVEDEEEEIQPKRVAGAALEITQEMERDIRFVRGAGQPLSASERAFFEPRFGADFRSVRMHSDTKAADITRAVNAHAFTWGRDIYFAGQAYQPGATEGRRLLAHELAHVVQQNRRRVPQVAMRAATDPVVPVMPQISLIRGVGRRRHNRVADVRVVQDRLLHLRYMSLPDHRRESPARGAAGAVLEANLAATIAAIRAFQRQVMSIAQPDGAVDRGGNTLRYLNRAIPRPTVAEMAATQTQRRGIRETVTRGVALTRPVGNVPAVAVAAGNANRPADVTAVQQRLEQLGHLRVGHRERPAAGAAASIPVAGLQRTIAAIRRFQRREVYYWRRRRQMAGAVTARVVNVGDATARLLSAISSYREVFPTGEDIRFRDYVRSGYTRNVRGTSYRGTARPGALPAAEYKAMGLTSMQTRALQYVSSHEGRFDALNTYDRARVSFGFIQFAGGRGLPPFMALLKSRRRAAFASMFQAYGVDVEFNVVRGKIANATIVVFDPARRTVLRGVAAEQAIQDSQRLSAIFIRAGRNIDVQRTQVEAATRDYVLPALVRQTKYGADILEVLSAPGGRVVATHVGAAARAFRASPAFAGLRAAGRIRARRQVTRARMQTLLASEKGLATLMDRAIQEGVGRGAARLSGAMRWVADQRGLADINRVARFEQAVLQQVVDDFTADIDIASSMERAIAAMSVMRRGARAAGATVAAVLARPDANNARTQVDNAIAALPRKSFGGSRTRLQTQLPPQRMRMNFAPQPASTRHLANLQRDVIRRLRRVQPSAGNARVMRRRVRNILASRLAAPAALAPTLVPIPAPTLVPIPAPAMPPLGDRHHIGEAVEQELTRLLADQGVPQSLERSGVIANMHRGASNL